MARYKCAYCDYVFDESEARIRRSTYEAEYDIPVPGYHPIDIMVCPMCWGEELEEVIELDDEEDEDDGEEVQPGTISAE